MASKLTMSMIGQTTPPTPYAGPNTSSLVVNKANVGDGNQDDQIEATYANDFTISAGATQTLNLGTVLDVYGDALAPDDVAAFAIRNNGPGDVTIAPGAANPWTSLLGAGSTLVLPAGASFMVDGLPKGAYPLTAPNSQIDIAETTTTLDAALEVRAWVRRTP